MKVKGFLILIFLILSLIIIESKKLDVESLRFRKWNSPFPYYSSNPRDMKEFLKEFPEYTPPPPPPSYEELWYIQTLDHFNFQNPQTFPQRYLISTEYWTKPTGKICDQPILFYTGNEGDIVWFYENSQFVTNVLAKELNALLLFAEHRYYGQTLPFGNSSLEPENIGWLTSEQALADYAELIPAVLEQLGASHCPVLSVGGSYGGMLTAWFRMKYPNVVDGALAASAPILYFLGTGINDEGFNQIATVDYQATSSEGNCASRIKNAIDLISETGTTPSGLGSLSTTFRLCDPVDSFADLLNWLEAGLTYMAMADYTSPANFLEPLPANPINVSCNAMAETTDDVLGLVEIMNVYFNYTGNVQCFNSSVYMSNALGSNAWDYQACTEMVMPITSDHVRDMFPVATFSLEELTEYCQQTWQTTPNPYWITTYYGGSNFTATNIIFSNGQRDPWRAGGVTNEQESTLVSFIIGEGAHHQDLRYPEPEDNSDLQEVRALETKYLQIWSNEASIRKQLK